MTTFAFSSSFCVPLVIIRRRNKDFFRCLNSTIAFEKLELIFDLLQFLTIPMHNDRNCRRIRNEKNGLADNLSCANLDPEKFQDLDR